MALEVLRDAGLPTEGYRSKSWDEFTGAGAPEMDFIFTVCDSAAGESCPVWAGHPTTAHWGIEDPAAIDGPEQRQAFFTALTYLKTRISLFLALPIDDLDEMALESRLKAIGRSAGATGNVAA